MRDVLAAARRRAGPRPRRSVELGIASLQAITLQYQILETLDVDVTVEELLGSHDIDYLATIIEKRAEPAALAALAEANAR